MSENVKVKKYKNQAKKKRQISIYLTEDEIKYIDIMYDKKFLSTRAAYLRFLLKEDMCYNGYDIALND